MIVRVGVIPDNGDKVFTLVKIAARLRGNHPDSAAAYLRRAIDIGTRIDSVPRELAFAHNEMGLICEEKAKQNEAEQHYLTAAALFKTAQDEPGLSKAYNNLGTIYREQGKQEQALSFFLKSLEIKERLNDDSRASPLNNIGLIFMGQGKYEKAITYYKKAEEIYERKSDSAKLVVAYNNLGEAYFKIADFTNSKGYFLRAIKIAKMRKDLTGLSSSYESIAKVFMKREEYDKALEYCLQGIDLAEQLGRRSKIVEITNTKADIFLAQKKAKEAIPILERNLAQEEELKLVEFKVPTLKLLVRAHKMLLHKKEAKQYEAMLAKAQAESRNIERTNRLNQMEAGYQQKPAEGP